jgi:DNA-binding MarR family transcriptional regulator
MRKSKDIKHLLDRVGARLRHPCDLDLLRFFRRHPRALLTSEQLAACVGYDAQQVGLSLDSLIGAGLMTRSQAPKVSARMYVLTSGGTHGVG